MNSFYAQLKAALEEGSPVVLGTAVDTLGDLGGGIPALVTQKAFLHQNQITAETPSMVPFWQGLFEGLPDHLPWSIEGETWRALMVQADTQDTAFPPEALELLAQGKGLVLATVVHATGNADCKPGAKLLADPDGAVYGTLGDSALQEQTIQMVPDTIEWGMPQLLNTETASVLLELVNL